MPICEFFGCDNGSKRKSLVKNPKIMLHRFPKDPILRDCWEKQIHQYGQTDADRKSINFNSGKNK